MKKHILLIISIIIGLTATYIISEENANAGIQENIAEKIIRFHIIANSDSDEDQDLKLKVKDAVLTYVSPLLDESEDINETRLILTSNTQNIINVAQNVVKENGFTYNVDAYITSDYFPVKSYGDITFPSGDYEAYKVVIGNSAGANWWCVMYPPLCFIDASHGIIPDSSKDTLKTILNEEEYDSISINSYDEHELKFQFKYLKFLNKWL